MKELILFDPRVAATFAKYNCRKCKETITPYKSQVTEKGDCFIVTIYCAECDTRFGEAILKTTKEKEKNWKSHACCDCGKEIDYFPRCGRKHCFPCCDTSCAN